MNMNNNPLTPRQQDSTPSPRKSGVAVFVGIMPPTPNRPWPARYRKGQ
jgi:hypothetical protein